MGFCLLIPFLILLMTGCSSSKNNQRGISENGYKRFMERQNALAADERTSKENPVMTSEGFERMGDFYVRQGNLPMAFLQYDKALRLDRNQPNIHYKMGRLFLEKGMAEEAQNEFLEVLKVNPQHAQAFEGMGWVFFKRGDFEKAEISRAVGMSASAEFPADIANGDHTDRIPVFLAKKSHGACRHRFLDRHNLSGYRKILQNFFINQGLYPVQLLVRNR